MELQLESVPAQIGTAMLDILNGNIIKSTGDLSLGTGGQTVCKSIFKILKDSAKCLEGEPMKRISLLYGEFAYVITLDDKKIYIVKVKSQ